MKQPFYKQEHFKKWTLFSFLVLSLGFNLSWNPNMVNLARHESQVFELAQTAPAEGSKEEIVDLSTYDPRIQMRLKIFKGEDAVFAQAERKTETEGTTEGCEKCRLERLKDPSGLNLKEVKDIKTIALFYLQKNQAELIAQTEKDKKAKEGKERGDKVGSVDPKAKGKEQFVEACREKSDSEIIDCQLEAMKDKTTACSKYDKECDKQVKALWKPVRQYLKNCLNPKVTVKEFDGDDSDCENATDVAYDTLENLRNHGIQTDVVRMLEAKVVADTRLEQSRLRRNKVDVFTAANLLGRKMDSSVSSVGQQMWAAIQNNDGYNKGNSEYYSSMYEANFGTPLWSEKQNMIKDPLNYNFAGLDVGDSTRSGATSADIARIRGRQGGTAVPATPQMLDQNGRIVNANGQPVNVPSSASSGYLSPAQRGQLNSNISIRQ